MEQIGEVCPLARARAARRAPAARPRDRARLLRQGTGGRSLHRAARRESARRLLDVVRGCRPTKPEPDLVKAAVAKAGGGEAMLIGDSIWDFKAAERAGVPAIGVLTGGFSEQELIDAGATCVFERIESLRRRLDETALAAAWVSTLTGSHELVAEADPC